MSRFAVILPAAGRGSRFHDKSYKKPFVPLSGKALWLHSAEKFLGRDDVTQTILAIAPEDRRQFFFKYGANVAILGIEVIDGGAQRADTVQVALEHLGPEAEYVCVHDAARPCLADAWIDAVFAAAERSGAAILALPVVGTLKRVGPERKIIETVSREGLWEAQTPQVFRRELLLEAYAKRDGFQATDEAQLVERIGHAVTVVPGSPVNIKITTKEDQRLAEQAVKALPKPKLPGPAHPLADGDLWR